MKWCWNNDDNRHRLLRLCLESIEQWTEFERCFHFLNELVWGWLFCYLVVSIKYRFCLSDENNDVKWHKCAFKTNTARETDESFSLVSKYIIIVVDARHRRRYIEWHSVDLHVKSFFFLPSVAHSRVGSALFAQEHRNINGFPSQRAMRQLVYYSFTVRLFFGLWFWRQKMAKKESNQKHLHRRRILYQMRWKHQC